MSDALTAQAGFIAYEKSQAEVKRLREALAFYADTNDYVAPYTGGLGKLYYDCGTVAKQALAEQESINE